MRQNLLLLFGGWQTASILAKGGFLVSKDFYSHRQSRWIIFAKALNQERHTESFSVCRSRWL